MSKLIIPDNYKSELDIYETQKAIKEIKDFFQINLSNNLNLKRVSAPLFVTSDSGLNDNLNGVERPVEFDVQLQNSPNFEIVHSLAKWKRYALKQYGFKKYEGLYTDMDAIRRCEEVDNLHSYYVDQWDWEKIIDPSDRNEEYLKTTVNTIYNTLKALDEYVSTFIPTRTKLLPDKIKFITSQQLEDMYPDKTPKEREYLATKEYKAIFLMKIGDVLHSGIKHDDRAPDYDDWSLNGDIILYNPILDSEFEISSMGVRVDPKTLEEQLKKSDCTDRLKLDYHRNLIDGKLPQTIGGGIGQSRLCMYFLKKAHIGEVQVSYWPEEMRRQLQNHSITLL